MRNVKVVKTMKNDQIIEILKNNAEEHLNDSRQIIKHKNNSLYGNQLGVVLSNIDNTTFEVFIHSKINGEVISQILYKIFNNIDDSTTYYDKLEKYVTDFDLKAIVDEINKNIKN